MILFFLFFRSLTTLGLVISALADQSAGKKKDKFVPYRGIWISNAICYGVFHVQ
jgi:hypothetical protein